MKNSTFEFLNHKQVKITKNQVLENCKIRILDLFNISFLTFRICPAECYTKGKA